MFSQWEEHKLIEKGLRTLVEEIPRSDIGELLGYVLSSPGKRVRPLILLFSAMSFNCPPKNALNAALAVELVHAASLVHDDILDGGIERRGAPSAVERFGSDASLLSGDYLISRSIGLMASYSKPVIEEFSKACTDMAIGEMLDMSCISSLDDYYHCVSKKTASLFAASAKIGGMIAGADEDDLRYLHLFGHHLGIAYQIVDDIEEVLGMDQGKRSLKSSITLPRIHEAATSAKEAAKICQNEVRMHAQKSRIAVSSSSASEEMKGRLILILDRMTESLVQECKLLEPLV